MNTTKQDAIFILETMFTKRHICIIYIFICGCVGGSANERSIAKGSGKNDGGIMESFKKAFDHGALIVNTNRLESWHLKIVLPIEVCRFSSTQEINDGF